MVGEARGVQGADFDNFSIFFLSVLTFTVDEMNFSLGKTDL